MKLLQPYGGPPRSSHISPQSLVVEEFAWMDSEEEEPHTHNQCFPNFFAPKSEKRFTLSWEGLHFVKSEKSRHDNETSWITVESCWIYHRKSVHCWNLLESVGYVVQVIPWCRAATAWPPPRTRETPEAPSGSRPSASARAPRRRWMLQDGDFRWMQWNVVVPWFIDPYSLHK